MIDSTADDFIVDWSRDIGDGITVRASAAFNVTYVSDLQLDLTVTLNNLADLGVPGNWKGGWSSIGWSSTPDILLGYFTDTGTRFDGMSYSSIPSLNAVEICFYSANNCNGGAQNSQLADGAVDSFSVSLYSWPDLKAIWSLENFGLKIQTDNGSFEWYGTVRTSTPPPPPPTSVPEPATVGLLGLGLLGLGLARRRRRA